ncbi:MAG: polymerase subunit sigma-24 [Aeromicrobium sp.]|nr:polymerase subunit sigma-24 [Aeromicrobium sp.]
MTGGERVTADEVGRALADAIAAERLRIVATLIRTTGDWDLAEDAVSDAAERALLHWPQDGIPDNPAAWLTATARRRATDVLRRADVERAKLAELAAEQSLTDTEGMPDMSPMTDDRLRLIFTCCHPALPLDARVALTLKVVSGLPTEAIGRAFLTSEATMGQRLLRAKGKIAHAGIPYRAPSDDLLPERLDGVLAVLYLVFTEGYATTARDLADEAIRLGRLLVNLMPDADEARALLSLMLLQHSRRDAREVDGERVTLERQDRSRWDHAAIDEGLRLRQPPSAPRGAYAMQADIAAVHAVAADADDTDWPAIVNLYDELFVLVPSPVVALNRSIAVGMSEGPLAGLAHLEDIADDPKLVDHYLVAAARGDLLARAGLHKEAVIAIERAAELAPTDQERRQLSDRAAELRRA